MEATPGQLHELLSYCIEFAQVMLKDSGEFYPFGASLSLDGKVAAVGGDDGNERPNPQDIYQLLARGFVSEASGGRVSGVALAANVDVPEQYKSPSKDALRVHLESVGFARYIYVPYEIEKSGLFNRKKSVVLHEPISVEIRPTFFPLKNP